MYSEVKAKLVSLTWILFKRRLEGGGVGCATEPAWLRTSIAEFSICWSFSAVESISPCIASQEAIQEAIKVSIVTWTDSSEILNLGFESKRSADCSEWSQNNLAWDGARRQRICSAKWYFCQLIFMYINNTNFSFSSLRKLYCLLLLIRERSDTNLYYCYLTSLCITCFQLVSKWCFCTLDVLVLDIWNLFSYWFNLFGFK